jgi:hypothetical protein
MNRPLLSKRDRACRFSLVLFSIDLDGSGVSVESLGNCAHGADTRYRQ